MLVALDVHYDDPKRRGTGAAVLFESWTDTTPKAHFTAVVEDVQPYVPGEFFRRELPILLAVIGRIQEPLQIILVDGYARLGQKPGLGQYLYEKLDEKIPVIGVAKSRFHGANAAEVLRGGSRSPLYITAAGIPLDQAANHIRQMHGPYRIPTLLKQVDRLAKTPFDDPFIARTAQGR